MNRDAILKTLIEKRLAKGLRQCDVAMLMGVGQQAVSRIEQNGGSLNQLDAYARAVGMRLYVELEEFG